VYDKAYARLLAVTGASGLYKNAPDRYDGLDSSIAVKRPIQQ
jgi:hypothetical protein